MNRTPLLVLCLLLCLTSVSAYSQISLGRNYNLTFTGPCTIPTAWNNPSLSNVTYGATSTGGQCGGGSDNTVVNLTVDLLTNVTTNLTSFDVEGGANNVPQVNLSVSYDNIVFTNVFTAWNPSVTNGWQNQSYTNTSGRFWRLTFARSPTTCVNGCWIDSIVLWGDNTTAFAPGLTLSVNNTVNNSLVGSFSWNITSTNTTAPVQSGYCSGTSCVISNSTGVQLNITVFNISGNTYLPPTLTYSFNITGGLNKTVVAQTSQGFLNVSVYQRYTNTSILSFNTTNNLPQNTTPVGGYALLPANVGANNLLIAVGGNYSQNTTCTLSSALTTQYCNSTGVFDNLFTIGANDTGNSISTFTVSIFNASLGGQLAIVSTTNGSVSFPALQGYAYNVSMNAPGYALQQQTRQANAATNLYNFSLLQNNSVYITVLDENTNALIPYNITVVASSLSTSYTNYTNNLSRTQFQHLGTGNYTVAFSGGGYNPRSYAVFVNESETQNLTAYLTTQNTTTVFIIKDSFTAIALPGALVTMTRIINGNPVIVESHLADITGQAQFSYTPNTQYTINVSLSGYTTKVFILNPVLSSSYTILMDAINSGSPTADYAAVLVMINPTTFYGNQTNNVNLSFQSTEGKLSAYGATFRYPGGTSTLNATNPYGSTLAFSFNISSTNILDTVNLTYTYLDTFGNQRTFSRLYSITSPAVNGTIFNNNGNTYGLGWFERTLISTIIVLFAAGTATILAGELFGFALGLFMMGFLMKINFMPLTAVAAAIIIGVLMLARRTS